MEIKPILGTAVGLQSVALTGLAAGTAMKMMPKIPKNGKINYDIKKQTKTMIKGATGLMIGIPLVKATSGMVNSL